MDERRAPTTFEPHPYTDGLNEPTIVAYDGMTPNAFVDFVMSEDGVTLDSDDSDTTSRLYVRKVRKHTAESVDELTIIPENSPLYRSEFEDLDMGEEVPF